MPWIFLALLATKAPLADAQVIPLRSLSCQDATRTLLESHEVVFGYGNGQAARFVDSPALCGERRGPREANAAVVATVDDTACNLGFVCGNETNLSPTASGGGGVTVIGAKPPGAPNTENLPSQ